MRIAIRRPDGAWSFEEPRAPFTPSGISDIDLSPSSSSPGLKPRTPKEQESKAAREQRKGYDRDFDVESAIDVAPPAYGIESPGYLNHTQGQRW